MRLLLGCLRLLCCRLAFQLGSLFTAEGVTGETGAAATAAVGATEYPIISILLETVSPENNDASAFASVMAWWGFERSA